MIYDESHISKISNAIVMHCIYDTYPLCNAKKMYNEN